MESSKIALNTSHGIILINIEDIICCIAHGRYSKIVTSNGKEFMLTRLLKELEFNLEKDTFFRTHKSYLVNLNHILKYSKRQNVTITMTGGIKVSLAKRRKKEFQKRLMEMAMAI